MDSETLMTMAAEKAAKEVDRESLEFLFRPSNVFELLVRIDLEGMERKITEFILETPMWQLKSWPLREVEQVIKREKFYRLVRSKYDRPM